MSKNAYYCESGQSFLLIPGACSGPIRAPKPERREADVSNYYTDSSPVVKFSFLPLFSFLPHRTSFQLEVVSVKNFLGRITTDYKGHELRLD